MGMRIILHSSSLYIFGAVVLIGIALVLLISTLRGGDIELVTTVAETGTVLEVVAVSGVVEAQNVAELAFPTTGVVTELFIDEGSTVAKGDVLATLASAQLIADRLDAVAARQKAEADKAELLAGPRSEERSVTSNTIANAERTVAQVEREQNEKVANARKVLLSSSLEARSVQAGEDATPPSITGTYACDSEGTYVLDVYSSGAASGYSYTLSGLGQGTYSAYTDAPDSFGSCGLFITFTDGESYVNSEWVIEIPNKNSALYQTNRNAYNLALQQRANAIEAAEDALALAREEATLANAPPRGEELVRANANILQAQARIDSIDAQMRDRSIIAPFDGIVTDVTILAGETAGSAPVITLLAKDAFELTARIPEIDITKIAEGQTARVLFDANAGEEIEGVVSFISPLAVEIDGVAYFEATITFPDVPTWIRSGLNADIDIVVAEVDDVVRVPKRFVTMIDTEKGEVLVLQNEKPTTQKVDIRFIGNDGFVAVDNLEAGTVIVAP